MANSDVCRSQVGHVNPTTEKWGPWGLGVSSPGHRMQELLISNQMGSRGPECWLRVATCHFFPRSKQFGSLREVWFLNADDPFSTSVARLWPESHQSAACDLGRPFS